MFRSIIRFSLPILFLSICPLWAQYYSVTPPGQGGDFNSIQDAVDALVGPPANWTIEVFGDSGTLTWTYSEEVSAGNVANVSSLTIVVASGHTVYVDGVTSCFNISAEPPSTTVTVDGFWLTSTTGDAISITGSYNTIRNCVFDADIGGNGISIVDEGNTIQDCTFLSGIDSGSAISISGNSADNNTITRNTIKSWQPVLGAITISDAADDNIITNNQIFTVPYGSGIVLNDTGNGTRVYFNSIYVNVNTASTGRGIYASETAPHSIYNNAIYAVTQTNSSAVAYCISLQTGSTAASDYNCLRARSLGAGSAYVGRFGITNYTRLSDWENGTGLDDNSIEYYPGWALTEGVSPGDLHLVHHTLRAMGTQISVVTDDIDQDTRDNPSTKPDIGCDEIAGTVGAIPGGVYTIDSGGGADYTSIQEAVAELRERGVSGAVTLSVTGGTSYRANIVLKGITGVTTTNPVTISNDTGGTVTIDGNYDLGTNISSDERGFHLWGSYATSIIKGFTIQNLPWEGMHIYNVQYSIVEENVIKDISGTGIFCDFASYTQILRNKVSDIAGAGQDGIYIYRTCAEMLLANNMIYNLPDNGAGIRFYGLFQESGVYFNSISVEVDSAVTKYGIYTYATLGVTSRIDVYNNIVWIRSTDPSGVAYGIYQASSDQIDSYFRSDYNDLYRAGGGGTEYTGHWDGTNYPTLADWQTAGGGRDPNSIAADPLFVSATDLHLSSWSSPCVNIATPISAVPDDFDGQTRISPEDIGCDEFGFTCTGIVYEDETEITPIGGVLVRVLVNGISAGTAVTDANGEFTITDVGYIENDGVLFYLDTGGLDNGATSTRTSYAELSIKIYKDRVVVRNDSPSSMSNSIVSQAKGAYVDTDIPYTTVGDNVTISSGFVLWVKEDATFYVNTSDSVITPSFKIAQGSSIAVADGAGLYSNGPSTVNGTLRLVGTNVARATLAYSSANTSFDVTITATGTLDASYFVLDTGTVKFEEGATITQLRWGTFEYTSGLARAGTDAYLDFSALTGQDRYNLPVSIKDAEFNGSSGLNVKASNTTPVITFLGPASGPLWGEDYDDDPYDRIRWETALINEVGTTDYYSTLQEALASASVTSGDILRFTKNLIINESIDLASYGKDIIIENAVLRPSTGLALYNSDEVLRGTLRNCVITKGGVDYVTLQNCTLFRRSTSFATLQVTNCSATNCIVEDGSDTTSTTFTTSITDATSSLFVNVDLGDFHILSSGAIDTGTDLSASFTIDFEGHTRGYDGDGDEVSEWDIGADEYMGTVAIPSVNPVNIGNLQRFSLAGSRGVAGSFYAYAITSGGAASSVYDNCLLVIDLSDLSVVADTGVPIGYQASGPIRYFASHMVSYSPYDRRIYLAVDADNNGDAERIVALRDTGGTLASAITLYTDFGGTGYKDYGVEMKALRADLFPDYPPYKHRLFFVTKTALGASLLYKVNIDWEDADDTDGNGVYSDTIWTNDLAAYEPNAIINYDIVNQYIYVSCSGDTNNYIITKLLATGNTSPSISTSWSNPSANQNRYGQTIISRLIHCAPSGGDQVFSTATWAASDERRWTSPNLAGGINSLTFRFFHTTSLMVEAGTYVYKLKDSGITIDFDNVADDPGDGEPLDPDWPRSIDGNVVSRITQLSGKIYWCSTRGWIYYSNFNGQDNTTSGDEDYVEGYPFRLPGHSFRFFLLLPGSTWKGLYFITDQGGILKLPLAQ